MRNFMLHIWSVKEDSLTVQEKPTMISIGNDNQ